MLTMLYYSWPLISPLKQSNTLLSQLIKVLNTRIKNTFFIYILILTIRNLHCTNLCHSVAHRSVAHRSVVESFIIRHSTFNIQHSSFVIRLLIIRLFVIQVFGCSSFGSSSFIIRLLIIRLLIVRLFIIRLLIVRLFKSFGPKTLLCMKVSVRKASSSIAPFYHSGCHK